jgi:hypothetical protein
MYGENSSGNPTDGELLLSLMKIVRAQNNQILICLETLVEYERRLSIMEEKTNRGLHVVGNRPTSEPTGN